jgi:hypothetical protein
MAFSMVGESFRLKAEATIRLKLKPDSTNAERDRRFCHRGTTDGAQALRTRDPGREIPACLTAFARGSGFAPPTTVE